MTTLLNPAVAVEASGLVLACSWCVPRPRLLELNRQYPGTVSHSLCPSCATRLESEAA